MQQLEREVKLEVGRDWSAPDLTGVLPGARAAALPTLVLQTTYYDTADMCLDRQRLALRFRHEARAPVSEGDIAGEAAGEHGTAVWTLKLPSPEGSSVLARTEITWQAGTASEEPPGPGALGERGFLPVHNEIVQLLAAVTLGRPLRPVARLAAVRRRTELRTSDGRPLAEVDHDTVTGTNLTGTNLTGTSSATQPAGGDSPLGDSPPSAVFTEVEVELAEGGTPEVLDAVVTRLLEAGARQSSRRSKLTTVLQLAPTTVPPDGCRAPGPAKCRRKALMADVLRQQAQACLDVVSEHDPMIRLGDPDPEHVHKSRVAARRLRSVLRAFTPLVVGGSVPAGDEAEAWLARLDQELRWLGQALGGARDADVRFDLLSRQCATLPAADAPGIARVLGVAAEDQQRAHQSLLEAMNLPRYMDLLRAIEALGRPPTRPGTDLTDEPVALSAEPTGGPGPASADVLCALWASLAEPACCVMPVLGRRQWRSLRRAVDRLGGDSPDADLHRARIRAKRLRYIAEVSAPNLTGVKNRRAAAYMAKEATALQDILGEVHDAAVNEQWLREVPSRAASVTGRARTAMIVATAMAAGQLVAAVRQSERASREAWSHPWERLRRKRVRSWMDSH